MSSTRDYPDVYRPSPEVTLYRGDCLHILQTLTGIDAVITDPPYSSGGMVRGDRMVSTRTKYQSTDVLVEHPNFTGDNRDQRGFVAWASLWLSMCAAIVEPGAMVCLFSDWRQVPCMTDALQSGGMVWRGIVPWDKVNARPMPNRFRAQCEFVVWGTQGPRDFETSGAVYHPGILRENSPATEDRQHATEKPVGIMQTLAAVAPVGGLVLDPFMGSGTTGIACIRTGRRFIGIEIDPTHYATACRRIDDELQQIKLDI